MLNEDDIIDTSKKLTFNPTKHDISVLAKCFDYRGSLPQVVIDRIVGSYNPKEGNFGDVTVKIGDFCNSYDSKVMVNARELNHTIHQIFS